MEEYFAAFDRFIKIVAVLINRYTSENDTLYGEEDYLTEFLAENEIDSFGSLFFEISQCDVKNSFFLVTND